MNEDPALNRCGRRSPGEPPAPREPQAPMWILHLNTGGMILLVGWLMALTVYQFIRNSPG